MELNKAESFIAVWSRNVSYDKLYMTVSLKV
jgi:hypothetical protein